MKKLVLVIIMIISIFVVNSKKEELIIPKEAIRFRVIANSNTNKDQETKLLVRNVIQEEMTNDLIKTNNLKEARTTLKDNINNYKSIIQSTLNNNNVKPNFSINYGMNYFPKKVYKGVTYEEGEYESLVVTLGNGTGNNWWCVLFPPLCLLEAEEKEENTEVEYKFFIQELIDKYLK